MFAMVTCLQLPFLSKHTFSFSLPCALLHVLDLIGVTGRLVYYDIKCEFLNQSP